MGPSNVLILEIMKKRVKAPTFPQPEKWATFCLLGKRLIIQNTGALPT